MKHTQHTHVGLVGAIVELREVAKVRQMRWLVDELTVRLAAAGFVIVESHDGPPKVTYDGN